MPLQNTSGSDTTDAYGGGAAAIPNYIENVFSTWLFAANNSTQTITNNIDVSTNGGMVWLKSRTNAYDGSIYDTNRGANKTLYTDSTANQTTGTDRLTSFNTNGFSLGAGENANYSSGNSVSWTFRKQPKFFDVQTFTQNGGVTVNHNLGSVPACIIIKSTAVADSWYVYHTSLNTPNGNGPRYNYLNLNSTAASTNASGIWINNITSTSFDITNQVIAPFTTYVAYIFASNAGGFGLTGSDNVITCGSYTGNGSATGPIVTLGYEPQWIMVKRASGGTGNWVMIDSMRGFVNSTTATPSDAYLVANTSAAESTWGGFTGTENAAIPLATGFQIVTSTAALNNSSDTYIYIAIRRGPMAVPTTGTSVFSPNITTNDSILTTTGFPVDMFMEAKRAGQSNNTVVGSRLISNSLAVETSNTNAEIAILGGSPLFESNVGILPYIFGSTTSISQWSFRRAPSFFDEVCYTGNGNLNPPPSDFKVSHNLTVRPEIIIIKSRSAAAIWYPAVAISSTQWVNGPTTAFGLNRSDPADTPYNFSTLSYASSTTFSPAVVAGNTGGGYSGTTNDSGVTYVAYLFATCPGVSKVGSYTGNGTTQAIACGFTGGARFVLIKRTDATGDWYVYDTARGMTTLTDPYLLLDTTGAEVATLGSVTTTTGGFTVNSAILAAINTSSATYIFLAIA